MIPLGVHLKADKFSFKPQRYRINLMVNVLTALIICVSCLLITAMILSVSGVGQAIPNIPPSGEFLLTFVIKTNSCYSQPSLLGSSTRQKYTSKTKTWSHPLAFEFFKHYTCLYSNHCGKRQRKHLSQIELFPH